MNYQIYTYAELLEKHNELKASFFDANYFDYDQSEEVKNWNFPALNDFFVVYDGDTVLENLHLTINPKNMGTGKLSQKNFTTKDRENIRQKYYRNQENELCINEPETIYELFDNEKVTYYANGTSFTTSGDKLITKSEDASVAVCRGIIVLGNLTVKHAIFSDNFQPSFPKPTYPIYPQCLYVTGSIKAKSIVMHDTGEIFALGNIEAEQLVSFGYLGKTSLVAKNINFNNAYIATTDILAKEVLNIKNLYSGNAQYAEFKKLNRGETYDCTWTDEPACGVIIYKEMPEQAIFINENETKKFEQFLKHLVFKKKYYEEKPQSSYDKYKLKLNELIIESCTKGVFNERDF